MGFGVLERRHNFGIDVSKYLGFIFLFELWTYVLWVFFFFFLRFSFDKDVNLGLQFVIGLLITSLVCEFSLIILSPNQSHQRRKKTHTQTHTCFGRIGRIPYYHIQSYTILHMILIFLRSYYNSKHFCEMRS